MTDNNHVQVVATSETFRKMLRFYLDKAGYEVETFRTGDAALRFTGGVPDAVICEENLEGMDGLHLIQQLRASPITAQIQIMLLAGSDTDSKVQEAIAAGANECMRRDAKVQDIGERLAGMFAAGETGDSPVASGPTGPAHTVCVISARGGSGKTFVATSLGVAFAQRRGTTTALLDLNLEFGTTAMMLDLRPIYTLRDVAEAAVTNVSDAEFDSMLLRHSSGLRVVPAVARPGDSELIPEGSLPKIIERLRRMYDHLVVDGRPSFREVMLDLWEASDQLVITCPPEVISVLVSRSLLEAVEVLSIDPAKILLVVNHLAPKARLTAQQVERGLGRDSITLPYGGEQLHRAVDVGRAYILERPNDPTAVALQKLADELVVRHEERTRDLAAS
jgi:pilus assembly protein CpaE